MPPQPARAASYSGSPDMSGMSIPYVRLFSSVNSSFGSISPHAKWSPYSSGLYAPTLHVPHFTLRPRSTNSWPLIVEDVATVILHSAVFPPSVVVTVTTAFPADKPEIVPFSSTEAMSGADEVHVTVLSVAFSGRTVAVRTTVPPTSSSSSVASISTPVT